MLGLKTLSITQHQRSKMLIVKRVKAEIHTRKLLWLTLEHEASSVPSHLKDIHYIKS